MCNQNKICSIKYPTFQHTGDQFCTAATVAHTGAAKSPVWVGIPTVGAVLVRKLVATPLVC